MWPSACARKVLPTPTGPTIATCAWRVEKAQGRELIEERAIEGDLRGGIPGLQVHGGIQMRFLHAERDGQTVAPGDFVAEDQQQQILMRHLLLARDAMRRSGKVSRIRDSRSRRRTVFRSGLMTSVVIEDSSPSEDGAAARSGRAYWVAGRR